MFYKYRYLFPLICLMVFFTIRSTNRPVEDFGGYYFGSKCFLEGCFDNSTVYETATFNQKIYADGYHNLLVSYTPFPPITSLFFIPFTFFELDTSKLIFNCLSIFVFLFSLVRLQKKLNIPEWVYLLIPVIFFIPLRNNIYFGQVYLILFSLMAEGFIFYKKEKYTLSSLLWGIAIVLKVFPLICLLFILFEKKWKPLFYLGITVFCLFIVSLFLNGTAVWTSYLFEIFPRVSNGELNDAFTPQFQSMFMLLKNMFVADTLQNPYPVLDSSLLFGLSNFLFKAFVLSLCAFVSFSGKARTIDKFSIWIIGSILISPNGSTYSLVMLLIPFLVIVALEKSIFIKGLLLALMLVINNLPVTLFFNLPLLFQFPRLYAIIILFIILISVYGVTFNYKVTFVFVAFFGVMAFPVMSKKDTDNSDYFLNRDDYLIINDYAVQDNKLILFYFNDITGEKQDTLHFNQQITENDSLYVKNNQIFQSDKQLTYTRDRKKKAVMLNSGQLLYLSDKHRGIGFYTLRTKKVF